MKCPICHDFNPDNSAFCGSCGTTLITEISAQNVANLIRQILPSVVIAELLHSQSHKVV